MYVGLLVALRFGVCLLCCVVLLRLALFVRGVGDAVCCYFSLFACLNGWLLCVCIVGFYWLVLDYGACGSAWLLTLFVVVIVFRL